MATPELSDSGVPQTQVDVLVKLVRETQAKLRKVVLQPPGGTEASRLYRQAWAAMQVRQIDLWMLDLGKQTSDWIGRNVPQAMIDGLERGERQARDAGVDVPSRLPGGSFAFIDKGTLKVFAHDIHADLTEAANSAATRAKRLLKQTAQQHLSESQINTILAGGVIEGRPVQTIRTLREELEKVAGNQITIKTKNGNLMSFETGYYASMVARTRTRQATVTARHDRLQQLDLDLVSIVGLISNNFCTAYLGEVYSLSGKSDKYPSLAELPGGGPPFHPNCSKSTRPFVEELASEKQLDMAEGDDDQSKMLNIDATTAQKRFKDLQIRPAVQARYATTARALFGKSV